MNQFPQMIPHTMGVTPQFPPGTVMPGTGMFLPPPPIGLPLGMSPGLLGMVPPGTMLPNQMQPSVTIAVPPKPEDTIANNVSASDIKVATTVFVGNISEKATDTLIRQILLRCGVINAWKRVQGASGKMQAFGFCEYSDPEATLRALRLLHNFKLGDKTLVVKVDSKTRKELVEYIAKKKLVRTGASEEEMKSAVASIEDSGDGPLDEELDEITKDADVKIMDSINQLVRDNVDVLTTSRTVEEEGLLKSVEESLLHMAKQSGKADENATDLTDVDMEDDMKHIVSDEIRRFRQSYKEKEEQKLAERMKEKDADKSTEHNQGDEKDKDKERSSRREHDRDRKDHAVERSHDRNRERQRSRDRSPIERSSRRDSTRLADRSKDRTNKEKEREKSFRDEEAYEQRRVDKRQRERDAAYKERLKHWETRERKKLKEYEREKLKEDEKQEEMEKDKKHLAEFLEDYDDDKDDNRYYKGSAFARRRREREIELDSDEKDRQHEREEIEALRLNMIKKQVEGTEPEDDEDSDAHSDIDMKEEEDIPLSKDSEEPFNATASSTYPPIQVQSAPNVSPTFKPVKDTSQSPDPSHYIPPPSEVVDEEHKPKLAFGLKSGSTASTTITTTSKRSTLEKVFNQEDEELFVAKKQRKLVPIEYSEEEQQAVGRSNHMSSDERKGLVQNLIKSIPTEKDELFAYNVKWDCLDDVLIEKRVKPWINKKIIEYIGEEETTLVDFIADKVSNHSSAQNVLEDVSMVLDEDTEVFVVKLWRLLIYETEAKDRGLSKNYQ